MSYEAISEELSASSSPLIKSNAQALRSGRVSPGHGERLITLLVLVLASPVLALLSFCILLGGQNPIFFQKRVGYRERQFRIFKFRTMPDEGWTEARRLAQESPVKRVQLFIFQAVSRVLRATGLDELPQFANILIGDMQIIGPRPLVPADFYALPDRREARCAALPGITGLAQVSGGQALDSRSKLALDLYMINNPSKNIVVKVVFRTILRIVGFTSATAKASTIDLERANRQMAQHASSPASRARLIRRIRIVPATRLGTASPRVTIENGWALVPRIARPAARLRAVHTRDPKRVFRVALEER